MQVKYMLCLERKAWKQIQYHLKITRWVIRSGIIFAQVAMRLHYTTGNNICSLPTCNGNEMKNKNPSIEIFCLHWSCDPNCSEDFSNRIYKPERLILL